MLRGAKGYACAYIVAQETLRLALSHIVGWEDTGGTPRWRCYMQMLLHVLVLPLCVVSAVRSDPTRSLRRRGERCADAGFGLPERTFALIFTYAMLADFAYAAVSGRATARVRVRVRPRQRYSNATTDPGPGPGRGPASSPRPDPSPDPNQVWPGIMSRLVTAHHAVCLLGHAYAVRASAAAFPTYMATVSALELGSASANLFMLLLAPAPRLVRLTLTLTPTLTLTLTPTATLTLARTLTITRTPRPPPTRARTPTLRS